MIVRNEAQSVEQELKERIESFYPKNYRQYKQIQSLKDTVKNILLRYLEVRNRESYKLIQFKDSLLDTCKNYSFFGSNKEQEKFIIEDAAFFQDQNFLNNVNQAFYSKSVFHANDFLKICKIIDSIDNVINI